jgi:uncharacterized Tic20 family protein
MATNDSNPPVETTPDERSLACLAHVLQIVGWIIAPLIIFAIRRGSKFVSFHALQALLLQLCYMVVVIVCMLGFLGSILASVFLSQGKSDPPVAVFIVAPLLWATMMLLWVTTILAAIIYGIKANRGEWARYPLIGRWAWRILHL